MGKAELDNIRKLHKIRNYKRGKIGYSAFIVLLLLMELSWMIEFVYMYINGNKSEQIVWGNDIVKILPFAAAVFTCIATFVKELYKGNISVFPQNNVTTYVSHWIMTLKYGGIFALMTGVLSGIGYGIACVVAKSTGRLILVNTISLKYFIIMTVYMLTCFILLDAVIKFVGVIFRKSRLALMGILVVITMASYIGIKTHTSLGIIGFFIEEDNFALFEIKAVITAVICFVLGYVLELKVKNSKNEIAGNINNVASSIIVFISIYIAILCFAFIAVGTTNSDGWSISKELVRKEYKLEVPKENTKYKFYTDDAMELYYKGISRLRVKKGKEAKVVVDKYELEQDGKNTQVQDVFRDLEFEVSFRDGKIYIDNKNFDGMYLYMPVPGLTNAQLQSFMGNDIVHCDFDNELINDYLSTYEITIYLPKEYLDKKISLEY